MRLQANSLNNKIVAEEHHKPIIRNFKRRKVYSSFKDNIWDVDLTDMQLISKNNKVIRYLLYAIDLFSRYSWLVPLKNKKGDIIVEEFRSSFKKSDRKLNEIWVDHGSLKCFDLISEKLILKTISFHQSCKCGSLLYENFCNNLQKWNEDKCRCECLKNKDCHIGYSWNVNNRRGEMKKLAALVELERFPETEECDVETSEQIIGTKNKTVRLIKNIKSCKPVIGGSILFICVSLIII